MLYNNNYKTFKTKKIIFILEKIVLNTRILKFFHPQIHKICINYKFYTPNYFEEMFCFVFVFWNLILLY